MVLPSGRERESASCRVEALRARNATGTMLLAPGKDKLEQAREEEKAARPEFSSLTPRFSALSRPQWRNIT